MIRALLLLEVTRSHWYKWAEEITKWLLLLEESLLHGFVNITNPFLIILDSTQSKKTNKQKKTAFLRSLDGFRPATVLFGNLVSYIKVMVKHQGKELKWLIGVQSRQHRKGTCYYSFRYGSSYGFSYHSSLERFSFIFNKPAVISGPAFPTWHVFCFDHLLHPTPASHSLITPGIYSGPLPLLPTRLLGSSKPTHLAFLCGQL